MSDKGYDMLDEDFNYYALFAFIVALVIGDYALSVYNKRRSLVRTFLTH
jgi:5-methylthioribose kinase